MLVKARLQLMDEEYERERERVRLCARLGAVDAALDCVRQRMAALEARYLRRYEDDDDDDVFGDSCCCASVPLCDTLEHDYDRLMDVNHNNNDDDVIEPDDDDDYE
jgi:hypothetical protein